MPINRELYHRCKKRSPCAYNTLQYYNSYQSGPPVPMGNISGVYVVPAYSSPGYDTLTHGGSSSCHGYFGIEGAYRNTGGSCSTQFVRKLCQ